MNDMTIESAKLILEGAGILDHPLRYEAKGYLAGHASRDPEVEKLQREIDQMTKMFPNWTFEKKQLETELSAERETSRKLVEIVKEAFSVFDDCIAYHAPDMVGREAREETHKRCSHGLLSRVAKYTSDLHDALKFHATPGHSPEGKTL